MAINYSSLYYFQKSLDFNPILNLCNKFSIIASF